MATDAATGGAGSPCHVVCVTGMHRSGTSLAARAVNLLGVSFGSPEALMPAGSDNPAGYWENRYIKEFDDELLAALEGSWDQPPVLAPGWERSSSLDELRSRAASILEENFAEARLAGGPMGWKEPRLSLLLPFWRTVVDIAAIVVVVRHPWEVAASLERRNGLPLPDAAILWLRYLLAAAGDDPGHLLIRQRDLSDDLDSTLTAIASHIGAPAPSADVTAAVAAHRDPALVHHTAPPVAPAEAHPAMRLALDVWNNGAVDLSALPPAVSECIRCGWLGSPGTREALAQARAEALNYRERLRKRHRLVTEANAAALGQAGEATEVASTEEQGRASAERSAP